MVHPTTVLQDIELLARLACESHKDRPTRIMRLRAKVAQLETPLTQIRLTAFRDVFIASGDWDAQDIELDGESLDILIPGALHLPTLNRRILW